MLKPFSGRFCVQLDTFSIEIRAVRLKAIKVGSPEDLVCSVSAKAEVGQIKKINKYGLDMQTKSHNIANNTGSYGFESSYLSNVTIIVKNSPSVR